MDNSFFWYRRDDKVGLSVTIELSSAENAGHVRTAFYFTPEEARTFLAEGAVWLAKAEAAQCHQKQP